MCARLSNFHPAPRWNFTCAHGWQDGGGLYISGTATLTNTNVYANRADDVSLPLFTFLEVSSSAPLERCLCSYGLQGGGLIIYSTATLTNANVYANKASKVCSPSVRSWHFHPVSRWNVACARRWQWGGGLSIHLGTATLTDTKVYANQAGYVCSPFELSSIAPLERYVLVFLLAGWRPLRRWHGNSHQLKHLLQHRG